jgi:hypothetical protein
MREYDVMKLAGHADFKTTHKYYAACARICCKTVAAAMSDLRLKKIAKHKCLATNAEQMWAGVASCRAHTEI